MLRPCSAARSAASSVSACSARCSNVWRLDLLARLDDDDRGLRVLCDGLRQLAEQRASRRPRVGRRDRCGAHDDQLGRLGLADDRAATFVPSTSSGRAGSSACVLDERRQRALDLGADDRVDVRRDDVHDVDVGIEVAPERGGVARARARRAGRRAPAPGCAERPACRVA